ncbi:trypsin-like peptidase domain-containing protein [Bengtsoniella intestinalis]|uniref:S1C family serine protease n=1 Tax=Bengtsoniella intestinalis TaxID=3073143 RepID=UPI00391FB41E
MEESISQQVTLTYQAPPPKEVVLTYSAPYHLPPTPVTPTPKSRKGLYIFLGGLGILAVVLLTVFFLSHIFHVEIYTDQESSTQETTIPVYDTQGDGTVMSLLTTNQGTLTPQEIYAQVNPAVVTVLCESGLVEMSMGTGVIYSQDGYIVTNYHVISGASSCAVALSTGELLQAYYVSGDEDYDLAVLKVNASGLPTATFAESDFLTVGDTVYAIGNPLGLELRGTFTDGIVSAINRDVEVDGRTMSTLIQTNAALNSGNSGGPLINVYGQVVGINTVKMGSSSAYNVEGIGFAIPSATVQRIVQDLVTVGTVQPEPVFGVSVGTESTYLANGTAGAEIYSVTPNTPADAAGVQVGDVFLSMNGQSVSDSSDVLRIRRQLRVGDTVEVSLWRSGQIITVELYLDMA